jgi:hypothetical protein
VATRAVSAPSPRGQGAHVARPARAGGACRTRAASAPAHQGRASRALHPHAGTGRTACAPLPVRGARGGWGAPRAMRPKARTRPLPGLGGDRGGRGARGALGQVACRGWLVGRRPYLWALYKGGVCAFCKAHLFYFLA